MKEILLIVLLVIAIVCDFVRIMQYRAMVKRENEKAIRKYAYKYRRLWRRFFGLSHEPRQSDIDDYANYCVGHWNDEED